MKTTNDQAPDSQGAPHVQLSAPQSAPPPNLDAPVAGSPLTPNIARPSAAIDAQMFAARLAFSVREAAQILGVSEKTVRRLVARRLLRVSRALRHLRIPKSELTRYLHDTLV